MKVADGVAALRDNDVRLVVSFGETIALPHSPTYNVSMSKRLPTWREMNMDDNPIIEQIMFDYYRKMDFGAKISAVEQLNRAARQLAIMGLRQRHPNATDIEVKRRLADLLLGKELAKRAYGAYKD